MKELNYFLDSNIFLRPLVKDDPKKTKECEILFERIKRGEIKAFTSNLILAEIVWLCSRFYKIEKEEIIKILRSILYYRNLKIIDKFDPHLALEIYRKYNIKFIDALSSSNPKIYQKKAIVVSYDKDFDKIGVIRKEPEDLIKK